MSRREGLVPEEFPGNLHPLRNHRDRSDEVKAKIPGKNARRLFERD